MIAVDKDVPIPPDAGGRGAPAKYPLRTMKVGESFFVPGKTTKALGGTIWAVRQTRPELVFTIRKVAGGVRVWRIR